MTEGFVAKQRGKFDFTKKIALRATPLSASQTSPLSGAIVIVHQFNYTNHPHKAQFVIKIKILTELKFQLRRVFDIVIYSRFSDS